jgi:hypothetical protein
LIWWSQIPPHSKFCMRQWKEWNMLWFILQLIHFMAIKYLQILVIDKNPNPNHNLWTVNVKYTIIKLNLYIMVYSIVLKFEKIWLSHTLNIIRKSKKSLFSKRKSTQCCGPLNTGRVRLRCISHLPFLSYGPFSLRK